MPKLVTTKLRREFLQYLRAVAKQRGTYLYRVMEDYAALALGGKRPWDQAAKR